MNNYFSETSQALDSRVSKAMRRVYLKMFLALIVTAATALLTVNSPALLSLIYSSKAAVWILLLAEVGIVIALSARLYKMKSSTATLLFYLFAIVNGLTLSSIFFIYSPDAIVKTFFITAATFGAMSIYGYCTNSDLTKVGSFLFMALIGLIICSVVNIFLHSTQLDWIISIVGVLIFLGLTAWDTQKIKQISAQAPDEAISKVATIGALSLYLDFINLFLYLLRIFGSSRD
jgi:hypothetical protein